MAAGKEPEGPADNKKGEEDQNGGNSQRILGKGLFTGNERALDGLEELNENSQQKHRKKADGKGTESNSRVLLGFMGHEKEDSLSKSLRLIHASLLPLGNMKH